MKDELSLYVTLINISYSAELFKLPLGNAMLIESKAIFRPDISSPIILYAIRPRPSLVNCFLVPAVVFIIQFRDNSSMISVKVEGGTVVK